MGSHTFNIPKNDTLRIMWLNKRTVNNIFRFKFTTKFKWRCLNCGSVTFINYTNSGIYNIYCSSTVECKASQIRCSTTPNIVESHYMRVMKEKQLEHLKELNQLE